MLRMAQEKHYEIAVSAATQYLAEQSDESADKYVFSYTITIRNSGTATAQLISRHWIIADARGQVQEVRGLGVVGAQPTLKPGESFEYTSPSPRRFLISRLISILCRWNSIALSYLPSEW